MLSLDLGSIVLLLSFANSRLGSHSLGAFNKSEEEEEVEEDAIAIRDSDTPTLALVDNITKFGRVFTVFGDALTDNSVHM